MGADPADKGDYGPEEAKRRFETALRAALATPPKPHKDEPRKRPKRGAASGPDRAAPSSGGATSASSSPRGGRGRP